MSKDTRRILVTSALPYANGAIHIGHLVEYIQTDIWVRFQKLCGHSCHYICADDTHGTPIMLKAEQRGVPPEQLIQEMQAAHEKDFSGFLIDFDHYSSTHSETNRALCEQLYRTLHKAGHIRRRVIQQFYDPQKNLFLPDRFIRGECPKCATPDQYGDGCEVCNSTYNADELRNPVSALSGSKPLKRETEHLFFDLPHFDSMLREWLDSGTLQQEVVNKLQEWFATGLKEWDISRDHPYFGFTIPGESDKYFYVWLDAPIGYLATLRQLCDQQGWDYQDFVQPDSDVEMYHFIGKDIMYFHCLFWPALLHGAGLRKPDGIFAHGFLTVNGRKMSKTRGTFIKATTWLQHLKPEYLRYYFATKLSPGLEDMDLNLDDFTTRVNADLVGKVVNIASRCARFMEQRFAGQLAATLEDPALHAEFVRAGALIREDYAQRHYARAMRRIMALADRANQYIEQHKPWVLAKQDGQQATLQTVCTMGLNLFRMLAIFLKPVLPQMAQRAEALFGGAALCWADSERAVLDCRMEKFSPLMTRVKKQHIDAVLQASQSDLLEDNAQQTNNAPQTNQDMITIQDFARLDLRVARIIKAESITGANQLLRLSLDDGTSHRQVLAGIKSAYTPEQLVGRLTVLVSNLATRKTRFGSSEGMVLAAGSGSGDIFLLSPDEGARPGMQIK